MKNVLMILGLGLMAILGNIQVQAKSTPAPVEAVALTGCDLNSEEVLAIQQALADYLKKQLSEIVAHTASVTITDCDESGWGTGTITLSYTGQPNVTYIWVCHGGSDLIIYEADMD